MAFRIALLFAPPMLSDDVYRYIRDGHVQNNGISPYTYRVDAHSMPNRTRVNNAWMASPYLPVAQVYFAAAYHGAHAAEW